MVFANGYHTPLYSNKWTPQSASSYAGTCIFLIFLAVLSRLVFAWMHALEMVWNGRAAKSIRALGLRGAFNVADKESDIESTDSTKRLQAVVTARGAQQGGAG